MRGIIARYIFFVIPPIGFLKILSSKDEMISITCTQIFMDFNKNESIFKTIYHKAE